MRKITEAASGPLKWIQPNLFKMHYELRCGEEEHVADLRFRSSWGSLATGESAEGCWTFKRVGFLQTRVTIRPCGGDTDIANFRNNSWSGGGTLEFPDGRRFPATTNFWQTRFEFRDDSGVALVRFESRGFLTQSVGVTIQPGALPLPELPWVVILGCYLTVMMQMDSAAVATGVPG
jgi:hypothetical protein